MSAVVTEHFKGLPDSAVYKRRVWTVSGVATKASALSAVGVVKNMPVAIGDRRLAGDPVIYDQGKGVWLVEADYTVPAVGSTHGESITTDPLDAEVQFWMEPEEITINSDVDLDGRPVVNTANDPADPMPVSVTAVHIYYLKNYANWEQAWLNTYKGAVCNDAVTLLGNLYQAEHVLCTHADPQGKYTLSSTFVSVLWGFLAIPYLAMGTYPFQHRYMDAGKLGWYGATPTKAPFSNGAKEVVSEPIRLDGLGKPLAKPYGSSIKVAKATVNADNSVTITDETPVSPTNAPTILAKVNYPAGSTGGTVEAVWLYQRKRKSISFAGIPL